MIARGSLWLPLAILLVLAVLSFWIERSVQVSANGDPATRTEPEGIMENFDALRTDDTGQPHYRLTARKLKHYSNSKRTELDAPRFVQLDPQMGEVTAVAQQATVSPDGGEVDLRGEVQVLRAARPGQSAMSLHTARLVIFPERDMLHSPGPVDVSDATLKLHAAAMEYNARQRVIKLTGRVKAHYLSGRS
jgi:lipopolysaccharide export system protein LptC